MRNHLRARRLALTALCAGTSLGAAGLAVAPGHALAATTVACSDITGSGSTLQTPAQQSTFAKVAATDGAFKNCTSAPSVYYNYESDDTTPYPGSGTGSGAGQTEFASAAPFAISPGSSSNGVWLDGFSGMDAAPNATSLGKAATAANTDAEVVPIMQAPVGVIVNLPSGCTISAQPKVTNLDLLAAWENNITWETLLKDAKAKPTGAGCNSDITLEARADNSGTTYAFRQYLYQLSQKTGDGVYTSNQISTSSAENESSGGGWPSTTNGSTATVSPDENDDSGPNQGSGGEGGAVQATAGSMGYDNIADAVADQGFTKWSSGKKMFWVEVQNNGTGTSTVDAAQPVKGTANKANCYAQYKGGLPTNKTDPDWSAAAVANPKMATTTVYPLCTLTYDEAWHSYANDATVASYYNAKYTGETATGVKDTVKDYLTWLLATGTSKDGQAVIPEYYSKLPANVDTFAAGTVKNEIAVN